MRKIIVIIMALFLVIGAVYILNKEDNTENLNNEVAVSKNGNELSEEVNDEKTEVNEEAQEDLEKYIRYGTQGSIDIGVLLRNQIEPNEEYLIFEVMINNHSIDVDKIDISKLVKVKNDRGIIVEEGFEWNITEGSGHHVFGVLTLPIKSDKEVILDETTKFIELELSRIEEDSASKPSRFTWEL